jgi:hypothetical protein
MPTTVPESVTFDANVQVPNDGEGATSASLSGTFLQKLVNRSAYLKAIVDVSGVMRFRNVADITALKAVAGMSTGDQRLVPGVGFYYFDASTTPLADIVPWILKPNAGPGQWVHSLAQLRGGYLATIGAGNKVEQAVPNRIVALEQIEIVDAGVLFANTANNISNVASVANELEILVASVAGGDHIMSTWTFEAKMATATTGKLQMWVQMNGAPFAVANSERDVAATAWASVTLQAPATPPVGTTVKIQLRAAGDGANAIQIRRLVRSYVHMRP